MPIPHLISTIFSPLPLGAFTLGWILHQAHSWTATWHWLSLTFGLLLGGPLLFLLVQIKRHKIADLSLSLRHQRWQMYLMMLAALGLTLLVMTKLSPPLELWLFLISILGMLLISLIINQYYHKISIHMMGIGAPLGIFVVYGSEWAILFLALIPLVGWARWKMKRHTVPEIISGTLVSAGVSWGVFLAFMS